MEEDLVSSSGRMSLNTLLLPSDKQREIFSHLNKECDRVAQFVHKLAEELYKNIQKYFTNYENINMSDTNIIEKRVKDLGSLVKNVLEVSCFICKNKKMIARSIEEFKKKTSHEGNATIEIYLRNKLKQEDSGLTKIFSVRIGIEAHFLLSAELKDIQKEVTKRQPNKLFSDLLEESQASFDNMEKINSEAKADLVKLEKGELYFRNMLEELGFQNGTFITQMNSAFTLVQTFETSTMPSHENSKFYLGATKEKKDKKQFNALNKINRRIVMFSGFFYNLMLISTLCSLPKNTSNSLFFIGTMAATTNLAEIVFKLLFASKAKRYFRNYYLFVNIVLTGCCVMFYFAERGSMTIAFISRALIGLVGGDSINKKYIKFYSKPKNIKQFSSFYASVAYFGRFIGATLFAVFTFMDKALLVPEFDFLERPFLAMILFGLGLTIWTCLKFEELGQEVAEAELNGSLRFTVNDVNTDPDDSEGYEVKELVYDKSEELIKSGKNRVKDAFLGLSGIVTVTVCLMEIIPLVLFYLAKTQYNYAFKDRPYLVNSILALYFLSCETLNSVLLRSSVQTA